MKCIYLNSIKCFHQHFRKHKSIIHFIDFAFMVSLSSENISICLALTILLPSLLFEPIKCQFGCASSEMFFHLKLQRYMSHRIFDYGLDNWRYDIRFNHNVLSKIKFLFIADWTCKYPAFYWIPAGLYSIHA